MDPGRGVHFDVFDHFLSIFHSEKKEHVMKLLNFEYRGFVHFGLTIESYAVCFDYLMDDRGRNSLLGDMMKITFEKLGTLHQKIPTSLPGLEPSKWAD